MITEIYKIEVPNTVDELLNNDSTNSLKSTEEKRIQENIELAKELGFEAQCSLHKIIYKKLNNIPFKLLNTKEYLIWCRFLPTSYWQTQFHYYAFDIIPTDVLEIYKECIKDNIFETYKIKTPELLKNDPALFEFVGNNVYLIARWGESLLSFEKIKRKVLFSYILSNFIPLVFTFVLFLFCCFCFYYLLLR